MENVDIITYQSIKTKFMLLGYGLVIFDECHHVAAKKLFNVAMNCPNAILVGLSATPKREDGEDMRIEAALGKIVYSITRRELIVQGYLCDAKVSYHAISKSAYIFWETYHEAYQSYIVNNSERNKKIAEIAEKAYSNGKKVLILCSQIDHMDEIMSELKKPHLMINGKLKKKAREDIVKQINSFSNGMIVVSSSVFDEGVDFPNLDTIILAAGGKSSIKLTQRVGRILRIQEGKKMAEIHDFVDNCKWLSQHYRRRRHLLATDFEVIDIGKTEEEKQD
jgi:superfamily II DNA or RNA helicase